MTNILFDSLKFLQIEDNLNIYVYVILENHLHLVASSDDIAHTMKKFKSFTKNQLITKKTITKDLEAIDTKIEEYLKALQFADAREKKEKQLEVPSDNLSKMKKRKAKLDKELKLLEEMGVTQYNRTDPDAKLMIKPAHNLMAYNVQIAVDSKYKFIVATDVSSDNNDHTQLQPMAQQCKEILQQEALSIVADTGYYSAQAIKQAKENNITPFVPIPKSHNMQKRTGRFVQDKFIYDEERDHYMCPNKRQLTKASFVQKRDHKVNFVYRTTSSDCKTCPLKEQCIPEHTAVKSIFRWEYQETLDHHIRMMQTDQAKKISKQRGSIAEHPFGTTKRTLGWDHFLVRGKEKVSGENAWIMFTYNFKRLINLIGIPLFKKLINAIKTGDMETIKQEIAEHISCFRLYLDIFLQLFRFFGFLEKKALF